MKKIRKDRGNWKGGKSRQSGYVIVMVNYNHPRRDKHNYVYEHILIAEKVLGKPLKKKYRVHHVNGIKHDNTNSNLVICNSHKYHSLLHVRQRSLKACGDVNKRKCSFCKNYDFLNNLKINGGDTFYHKSCQKEYNKNYYRNHILADLRLNR